MVGTAGAGFAESPARRDAPGLAIDRLFGLGDATVIVDLDEIVTWPPAFFSAGRLTRTCAVVRTANATPRSRRRCDALASFPAGG